MEKANPKKDNKRCRQGGQKSKEYYKIQLIEKIKRFILHKGYYLSKQEIPDEIYKFIEKPKPPDELEGLINISMIAMSVWFLRSIIKDIPLIKNIYVIDITFYNNSTFFDFILEAVAYTAGFFLSVLIFGAMAGFLLSYVYGALFRRDSKLSKFILFFAKFSHKFIIILVSIIFLIVYTPLSYSEFKSAIEPEVSYTESEETISETTEEQNNDEDYDIWQVDTDKTPLTIREEPSKDSKKIGSLSKGAIAWVTAYDETGQWGYAANTETNNENDFTPGWINLEYCTDCIAMGGGWVYLLEGEPYYHTKNCEELKDYSNETIKAYPRDDASEDGYEPCPKCGGF